LDTIGSHKRNEAFGPVSHTRVSASPIHKETNGPALRAFFSLPDQLSPGQVVGGVSSLRPSSRLFSSIKRSWTDGRSPLVAAATSFSSWSLSTTNEFPDTMVDPRER